MISIDKWHSKKLLAKNGWIDGLTWFQIEQRQRGTMKRRRKTFEAIGSTFFSFAYPWIASLSDSSADFLPELDSWVLFSLKLATITCVLPVIFALKLTTFSCSHSSGQRWRRLTNFPVNSTLMVAMLVKLLFLIVSNASPATSFEGRFSRSKYALCCCSDLLGLSAYLRLTEILLVVQQLFLGLSENISARHLQRVLEYGLLYNGLFTRFWWMIANQ